ncbi:hypothetical protein GQ53DRAFT_13935 [Thozetella sp. PMI_491]|nr:hypothetical protein GQ53DRAFT_13935 [Thozetella sp. PMI_491]
MKKPWKKIPLAIPLEHKNRVDEKPEISASLIHSQGHDTTLANTKKNNAEHLGKKPTLRRSRTSPVNAPSPNIEAKDTGSQDMEPPPLMRSRTVPVWSHQVEDAERAMATTMKWTPMLARRVSFSRQEYKHALHMEMMQNWTAGYGFTETTKEDSPVVEDTQVSSEGSAVQLPKFL